MLSQIVKWGESGILQCDRGFLASSESNSEVRVPKTHDHIKLSLSQWPQVLVLLDGMGLMEHRKGENLEKSLLWVCRLGHKIKQGQLL